MSDEFDPLAPGVFERELGTQPGYLIRRLNQIHLALFAEECAGFGITPLNYSILACIAVQPGVDQAALSVELGVDRQTLINMAGRLEEAGYVRRVVSRFDKRQKLLTLAPRGKALLDSMQEPVSRAHVRTIEALAPEERAVFMDLLMRLVEQQGARRKGK